MSKNKALLIFFGLN